MFVSVAAISGSRFDTTTCDVLVNTRREILAAMHLCMTWRVPVSLKTAYYNPRTTTFLMFITIDVGFFELLNGWEMAEASFCCYVKETIDSFEHLQKHCFRLGYVGHIRFYRFDFIVA